MNSEEILDISRALFSPDSDEDDDITDEIVEALEGSIIDDDIAPESVDAPEDTSDEMTNELKSKLMNDLLVPRTQKQYNVQIKKFAIFCGHVWDNAVDIPKLYFTDFKIAGFLHDLASKSEYVPHAKKAAVASLNYMVKKYGLPALNSYDQHVHWPLVYRALEVL